MSVALGTADAASWAAIFGSGVFHGINPAMGWLFATALGLQRGSRAALFAALPPLALGHALSVFVLTSSALAFSFAANASAVRLVLGAALIGWAGYHHLFGHRHRMPVGMTAGFAGLALWSAATATLHGAGLMLVPALMPLCAGGPSAAGGTALAATLVHTAVASATSGLVAFAAYEYLGLGMLRRGWVNFDWLWSAALAAAGAILIATSR
ncbi:hypothetical protein WKR88_00910 [Trinickia caryophylli]|uniref:HupE / UreJ protein n=1 Tax=Trinickia caryophylli TaxID=28094 RepID=A0A1X7CG41_TRICW|nr:hypothetical protein [Trinickia caryophylli]PMS11618.1 hypothetical protein C0Z17_14280 [Trinickia caryophylli]TRX19823.1 hypothetical protein FNF07_17505 [Trinickia caryophylli]WQE12847.1 hypothetical protein U0034_05455 [Trinickia caryophylli]SME95563.1 hypothetical protein SAMN06295900_101317 [Trinickia caryophylli]GLU30568.1 hypothetical protein Busp01_04100 [Trinickia caryophylli]